MKAKCINVKIAKPYGDFTLNGEYEVVDILDDFYCVIDDVKDRHYVNKHSFKIIEK